MKKILFLALSLLLLSCSNDDEQNTPAVVEDLIVGDWTKTAVKYELVNGTTTTQSISGCDLQDKLIINADGTFQEVDFGLSAINDNCVPITSGFTGSRIWVRAGNGNYFFRKISTNANYDNSITIVESVVFTNNKMTLRIKETQADLSDPTQVVFYEEVYQKN